MLAPAQKCLWSNLWCHENLPWTPFFGFKLLGKKQADLYFIACTFYQWKKCCANFTDRLRSIRRFPVLKKNLSWPWYVFLCAQVMLVVSLGLCNIVIVPRSIGKKVSFSQAFKKNSSSASISLLAVLTIFFVFLTEMARNHEWSTGIFNVCFDCGTTRFSVCSNAAA